VTGTARSAALIALICLVVRLGFFLAVQPWNPEIADRVVLFKDGRDYHRTAINFVQHHRFAVERDGPLDAYRTPLFPLLAGSIYLVCGVKPWLVLLANILLDTGSCVLLYSTLKRHLDGRSACAAGVFYALDPILVLYCCHFLTDILFVFCCVLGASLLASALAGDRPRLGWTLASGAAFGAATLARPIGTYVPFLVAALTLFLLRTRKGAALRSIGAFVLAFVLVLLPWMIRNQSAFGSFALSTSGPFNMLALNVAPAEADRTGESLPLTRYRLFEEADEAMRRDGLSPDPGDPFTSARYWQRVAVGYVKRDPVRMAVAYVRGIAYMFANLSTGVATNMLEHHPGLQDERKSPTRIVMMIVTGLYQLLTYACLIIGLLAAQRARRSGVLLIFFAFAVYVVVLTGGGGMARFKLPAIPFYLAFAGLGFTCLVDWMSRRGSRATTPAATR